VLPPISRACSATCIEEISQESRCKCCRGHSWPKVTAGHPARPIRCEISIVERAAIRSDGKAPDCASFFAYGCWPSFSARRARRTRSSQPPWWCRSLCHKWLVHVERNGSIAWPPTSTRRCKARAVVTLPSPSTIWPPSIWSMGGLLKPSSCGCARARHLQDYPRLGAPHMSSTRRCSGRSSPRLQASIC
jgi:hypothetical protein